MINLNPNNLRDGGINTSLLTAKLRDSGHDGKKLLYKLMYEANVIVQADGTISGANKTTFTDMVAFLAIDANIDKIVKKY